MPEHEGQGEIKETPKELPHLKIVLHDSGQIEVTGNVLTQQIIAFGMLENAKIAIINFNMIKNQSKLVKPQGSIIEALRKKRF